MTEQGLYTIIERAVMLIRADEVYGPRLSNCWLPAATWVEAINITGHIDAAIAINVRKFNAAMSRATSFGSVMSRFDGMNRSGVFRVTFSHQQFYYFTQENKQIAYPSPLNGRWKERVQDHASYVLVIPPTRARPAGAGEDTTSTSTTTIAVTRDNEPSGSSNIDEQPSPRKRPRLSEREDEVLGESAMSYWPDSSEARKLFRPRVTRAAC
jgi:hypothetical protein